MHIGFYSYYKQYNNNRLLTDPSSLIGDSLNYPFVLLAQQLKSLGHTAATIDTAPLSEFDAAVFVEFPGYGNPYFKKLIATKTPLYLITLESPLIKPDNYLKENHRFFTKIFTWDDTLVDNITYFKIQYSHQIPHKISFDNRQRTKLCTIIAGNKSARHPKELYSERIAAIRWFEQHHPQDFNLYGTGWDRYHFNGTFLGIKMARLNRLTFLTKLLAPYYPSYKGRVNSKKETYQGYKFSIAYENARDIPGYITEKIFDCFLAGCVPIYLGAQNISDHIPANTFIDKREFPTYEKLYDYLRHMSRQTYQQYQDTIKQFLESPTAYPFSAEGFAKTIADNIII